MSDSTTNPNPTSELDPTAVPSNLTRKLGMIAIGDQSYGVHFDSAANTASSVVTKGRRFEFPEERNLEKGLRPVGKVDGLDIPTGLTVIVGPSNAGKTPLLHYILEAISKQTAETAVALERFGEPLPGYLTNQSDLVRNILLHVHQGRAVIGIDSFKNMAGRLPGGLWSSGLSRELAYLFSDLSAYFATIGVSVIVVLNAATTRADALAELYEGIEGGATGAFYVGKTGAFRYTIRSGEGLPRLTGNGSINWSATHGKIDRLTFSGKVALDTSRVSSAPEPLSLDLASVVSSPVSFGGAVRRAVARNAINPSL